MTDEKNEAVYRIDVRSEETGAQYAQAYGSLAVINYVASDVAKQLAGHQGDATAEVHQVDGIGGADVRKVLAVTADGDSVADLLRKRIKNERKSRESAPAIQKKALFGE